nr:condensation domain-containing protein [Acidobacteriota bacterium]
MIARENVRDILPLSPLQQGMLFHAESDASSHAYHEQLAYRIDGPLDVAAFRRAWELVVERHDALRAAFVHRTSARPLQVILKSRAPEFTVREAATLDEVLAEDRSRPFDLERDPLVRVMVVRVAPDEHLVVWSYHHILLDGWCVPIVLEEVLASYSAFVRGEQPRLEPAPPYSRYFEWLRTRDENAAVAWFANELRGIEGNASFPGRGTTGTSGRATYRFAFTRGESDALRALARQIGVTLPIVLDALWGILLARHNHARDVVFGTTVSGRPAVVMGIERMAGLFINTIPLRVRYDGATTLRALAAELHARFRESEEHHHAPLAAIQSAVATPALFDHLFIVESYPVGERLTRALASSVDGLRIAPAGAFEQTNYDVVVAIAPDEEIVVNFDYDASRIAASIFPRLVEHWRVLARAAATDPEQRVAMLPLITDAERDELRALGTGEIIDIPHRSLTDAFRAVAESDAPAVIHGERTLTFRDLDEASNRIAAFLVREHGVQRGDRVLLDCGRTHDTIAALLGILKAGAAYVPVDPLAPPERVRAMREDAGCVAVLDADALRRALAAPAAPPQIDIGPGD